MVLRRRCNGIDSAPAVRRKGIGQVVRVSVETVKIVNGLPAEFANEPPV